MKLSSFILGTMAGVLLCAVVEQKAPAASGGSFMGDMDVAMKRMDHDMAAAPMTGQADHDFVTMMVPHHQGAIDMAEGELAYGKDPALRRLAQEIIVDQKSEIDVMNLWLKKHADKQDK